MVVVVVSLCMGKGWQEGRRKLDCSKWELGDDSRSTHTKQCSVVSVFVWRTCSAALCVVYEADRRAVRHRAERSEFRAEKTQEDSQTDNQHQLARQLCRITPRTRSIPFFAVPDFMLLSFVELFFAS